MSKFRKINLDERQMPDKWYNIMADMPNKPLPMLHPATKQPVKLEDMTPLFPLELLKQEMNDGLKLRKKYRIFTGYGALLPFTVL